MEQLKATPELKISGNVEENWRKFKQFLTLYLQAMSVSKKEDSQKVALLLRTVGSGALDVFNSLHKEVNYETVVQKFGDTPHKN